MKYTKVKENAFQTLQLNAGIFLSAFTPETGSYVDENILGSTTGGATFSATPTYIDFAADVDNAKKNMMEFKRLDDVEAKMSGTFVSMSAETTAKLCGSADVDTSTGKITPRSNIASTDFSDIWWVGDYSDKNGETNGGFIAIRLINALSTGGFQLKSSDKEKGQFAFEFTGHYSIQDQDVVPYEIYIKAGTSEPAGG